MSWSDLDLDPEQRKARLARIGASISELVADRYDALPEEHEWYNQASFEEKLHRALVYFGDQQHPQPQYRTEWMIGRTRGAGRATAAAKADDDPLKTAEEDDAA